MMEVLPKPFGVVNDQDEVNADVIVSGTMKFEAQVGAMYYTDTMGSIYHSNMFYGGEFCASEAVTFVDLQEDFDIILSRDSYVGTGISKKKILLGPKV